MEFLKEHTIASYRRVRTVMNVSKRTRAKIKQRIRKEFFKQPGADMHAYRCAWHKERNGTA